MAVRAWGMSTRLVAEVWLLVSHKKRMSTVGNPGVRGCRLMTCIRDTKHERKIPFNIARSHLMRRRVLPRKEG